MRTEYDPPELQKLLLLGINPVFVVCLKINIPKPAKEDSVKIRVGDYRVIYTIIDGGVLVLSVGHRSKVYR